MILKKLRAMSCALLALACGAVVAHGEIVTFEFAGSLAGIQDPGNVFQDRVAVGAPAFVSLRYDTDSPDIYPQSPGRGGFITPGWLVFDIGGLKFERTTDVSISVIDPPGAYSFFSASGNGDPETWPTPFAPSGNLFLDLAYFYVPLTFPPSDGDVLPTEIGFSEELPYSFAVHQTGTDGMIEYELRLSMTPVPEPATWALMGLGIAGACWRARRR